MSNQQTPKAYAFSVLDDAGKLIAAEFVEDLPIGVLDAIERWTDLAHEFRIVRVMETVNATAIADYGVCAGSDADAAR